MKRPFVLLLALLMAALLCVPALAEAAGDDAGAIVEEAAEAAEEALEEAAEDVEAAAEAAEAAAEEAAGEAGAAAEAAEAAAEAAETATETAEAAAETAEEAAEDAEDAAGETEAAEAAPSVSPVFEELLEVPWYTWALLAVLAAAGVVLALGVKKNSWNSRGIAMGAMCIAISFVLGCIRLFRMPQGGSIDAASMLPLVLFMAAYGPLQGFVVGCAYGLLQLITDPYVIHPVQLLLDYPLATGAMILGCLAMRTRVPKQLRLPLAVLLAGVGKYIMAVLSGSIFFSEYAGDQNAWIYSMIYNISYLGPNVLVSMLIAALPGMPRLVDAIRGKKA